MPKIHSELLNTYGVGGIGAGWHVLPAIMKPEDCEVLFGLMDDWVFRNYLAAFQEQILEPLGNLDPSDKPEFFERDKVLACLPWGERWRVQKWQLNGLFPAWDYHNGAMVLRAGTVLDYWDVWYARVSRLDTGYHPGLDMKVTATAPEVIANFRDRYGPAMFPGAV